jgi:hypothetical protein
VLDGNASAVVENRENEMIVAAVFKPNLGRRHYPVTVEMNAKSGKLEPSFVVRAKLRDPASKTMRIAYRTFKQRATDTNEHSCNTTPIGGSKRNYFVCKQASRVWKAVATVGWKVR